MSKTRDLDVDIAKGIGIILMVIGHSGCPKPLYDFIYLFHMPLFYFIAGYLFQAKYLDTKVLFVKRRMNNLWLPFIKYNVFFIILHNWFFDLNLYSSVLDFHGDIEQLYTCKEGIIRVFYTLFCFSKAETLLGGFWFLRSLFISSILFLFLLYTGSRFGRYTNLVTHFFAVLLVLVVTLLQYLEIILPIGLEREILAACIMYAGYLYRRLNAYSKFDIIIIIVCVWVLYIFSIYFPMQFGSLSFDIPSLALFIGIVGSYMILLFSHQLIKFKIHEMFIYLGANTISILAWHFLMFKVVSLMKIYIYDFDISWLAKFPIISEYNKYWWVLYSIIGIVLSLAMSELILVLKKKCIQK